MQTVDERCGANSREHHLVRLLKIRLEIFLSLVLAAVEFGPNCASQTAPVGAVRHDDASQELGPEARIARLENGLVVSSVIIPGQPFEKSTLAHEMSSEHVPGLSVAVIDGFSLAWAKGYGVTDVRSGTPVTAETLFCAGGISKFVTAVAVLRLVEAKRLDLDEEVNRYLVHWKVPRNQFTSKHPVTIRELLSHSAGTNRHHPATVSPSEHSPDVLDLLNGAREGSDEEVLDVVAQPGGRFRYSSGGFLLLQQMLTDVEGQPFDERMRQLVLVPSGMSHSTYVQPSTADPDPLRASGHSPSKNGRNIEAHVLAFPELAGSGLWTTASDLALLVINLQHSGEPGSLLSRSSYEILVRPVISNAGLGVFLAGDPESRRFRVRTSDSTPEDTFEGWLVSYIHGGKDAIVLANAPTSFNTGFSLMRSIALEYNWNDFVDLQPNVIVDSRIYPKYVGRYHRGDKTITVSTTDDGQTLLRQIGDSEKVPLYPYSATEFLVSSELLHDTRLEFVCTRHGDVTSLKYIVGSQSFVLPRLHERDSPN